MSGTVRVVSKRKGGAQPRDNETVIDVDRTHHVLGNRHVLHDYTNSKERAAVIAAYAKDFSLDTTNHGPMWLAVMALTERVRLGESLALRCWCAPRPCHADILKDAILETLDTPT